MNSNPPRQPGARVAAMVPVLLGFLLSGAAGAATFTVTSLDDSGSGTLRRTIMDANAASGADTIVFEESLAGTIVLESALPSIIDDVDIVGPGPKTVTVSGNDLHRPFEITIGVDVMISGLSISDGLAANGAGISNAGRLTLQDCVVSGNATTEFGLGGGIDNFSGTLLVTGCTIQGNGADIGGGISNDATLTVVESNVSGNVATSLGGGIDNAGTGQTVVIRSLISNNATQFGGGIGNGGFLAIENSTISGNTASGDDGSSGGGIDNVDGTVELLHATLANNSASVGGGIWTGSDFTAKNSLIVENAGGNCFVDAGTFQAPGDNMDTDASCPGFAIVAATALELQGLADNGGPTRTHALPDTSAAVDAASDCTELAGTMPVTVDQRGFPRPEGAGCDLGAFEAAETDLIFADGFE